MMEHARSHDGLLVANFERRLSEYKEKCDWHSEMALTEAIRKEGASEHAEAALAAAFEREYQNRPSFRTRQIAYAFESKLLSAKRSWLNMAVRLIPDGDEWLRKSAIIVAFGRYSYGKDNSRPRQYILLPGIQEIRDALVVFMSEEEVLLAANHCRELFGFSRLHVDNVEFTISNFRFLFPLDPWVVSRALSTYFAQDPHDSDNETKLKSKARTFFLEWWSSICDPDILAQVAPVVNAWNNGLSLWQIHEKLFDLSRPSCARPPLGVVNLRD